MNILDTLTSSELKPFKTKSLSKGQVLFRENDKCEHVGIVSKGQIKIISYLENGDEVIYNTITRDQMFGNNLIFSKEPYYKGNIITIEDSNVVLIKKKDLIKLLQTNESFMLKYFEIQADIAKTFNNKIKLLSMSSAEERFYFYMHENKNFITISSINELASQLFIKRETLSRLLSKLIKEKRIIKKSNTIKLI